MVREKLERIGRANVILVAAPRITSHLLDRVFPNANLAVLERPESLDPIVEQEAQAPAEALSLLVSKIANVEGRVLELPFELRSARFPPACRETFKHGLKLLAQAPVKASVEGPGFVCSVAQGGSPLQDGVKTSRWSIPGKLIAAPG